jgi:hypothetical protein
MSRAEDPAFVVCTPQWRDAERLITTNIAATTIGCQMFKSSVLTAFPTAYHIKLDL